MKILKKNDCLNEFLKGKTAAKNSYFEFIFTALMVILTVIRNLRLIKQLFHRDCAELNCVRNENKRSCASQKRIEKHNQLVDNEKSLLSRKAFCHTIQ